MQLIVKGKKAHLNSLLRMYDSKWVEKSNVEIKKTKASITFVGDEKAINVLHKSLHNRAEKDGMTLEKVDK